MSRWAASRISLEAHLASLRTQLYTFRMSITELLPAVHSLPDPDKLQLIRILAEDLTGNTQSPLDHLTGSISVWTPHRAFDAADALLAALQTDDQRLTAHA